MSRNFGGGTVMIWGAFSYIEKLPIAWISSKMKSTNYVDMLETCLVEHAEDLMGPDYIFQHDNVSTHASKLTKQNYHKTTPAKPARKFKHELYKLQIVESVSSD